MFAGPSFDARDEADDHRGRRFVGPEIHSTDEFIEFLHAFHDLESVDPVVVAPGSSSHYMK
jgi:hypothetical protein